MTITEAGETLRRLLPSQHIVAVRDPRIREQIQYHDGDYIGYVMSNLPSQVQHGETTDFLQNWMPSSLVFSVNTGTAEQPKHVWIVFHHRDHDGKVVEFFQWELQQPRCTIEPHLRGVLEEESMLQIVCDRAYERNNHNQDSWPLYLKFVCFLVLASEAMNQEDVDSTSDESSDENP